MVDDQWLVMNLLDDKGEPIPRTRKVGEAVDDLLRQVKRRALQERRPIDLIFLPDYQKPADKWKVQGANQNMITLWCPRRGFFEMASEYAEHHYRDRRHWLNTETHDESTGKSQSAVWNLVEAKSL